MGKSVLTPKKIYSAIRIFLSLNLKLIWSTKLMAMLIMKFILATVPINKKKPCAEHVWAFPIVLGCIIDQCSWSILDPGYGLFGMDLLKQY